MRTLFLLNPTAGKADCTRTLPQQINVAAARAGLAAKNIPFRSQITPVMPGSWPMPLRSRPGRAGKNWRVFTAGGDGTFNEALTGIYGYANAAWAVCPLAAATIFLRTYGTRKSSMTSTPSWRAVRWTLI